MTGRPVYEATKDQRLLVQIMSSCGFPQAQIAETLGIDPKTLRKVFRTELKTGKAGANAVVAQSLFKKATGTGPQSVTAAIFWLKTQAGWKEPRAEGDDPLMGKKAEATKAAEKAAADPVSKFGVANQPKRIATH